MNIYSKHISRITQFVIKRRKLRSPLCTDNETASMPILFVRKRTCKWIIGTAISVRVCFFTSLSLECVVPGVYLGQDRPGECVLRCWFRLYSYGSPKVDNRIQNQWRSLAIRLHRTTRKQQQRKNETRNHPIQCAKGRNLQKTKKKQYENKEIKKKWLTHNTSIAAIGAWPWLFIATTLAMAGALVCGLWPMWV